MNSIEIVNEVNEGFFPCSWKLHIGTLHYIENHTSIPPPKLSAHTVFIRLIKLQLTHHIITKSHYHSKSESAYISACIQTDMRQLTVHAFYNNLMVHQIRRTADNSTPQGSNHQPTKTIYILQILLKSHSKITFRRIWELQLERFPSHSHHSGHHSSVFDAFLIQVNYKRLYRK